MKGIYERVRELVAQIKEKMTEEELFGGPVYKEFCVSKVRNIISGTFHYLRENGFYVSKETENRLLGKLRIFTEYNSDDDTTAYVASNEYGEDIRLFVNLAHPLCSCQKTREERHLAKQGLLYHEVGHLLFTDFPTDIARNRKLLEGKWFPRKPVGATASSDALLTLDEILADEKKRKILLALSDGIANAMEDAYIEREIAFLCPGRGKDALDILNVSLKEQCSSMEEDMAEENASEFVTLCNQILSYAKFGDYKTGAYDGDLIDTLDSMIDIIDEYKVQRDPAERAAGANEVLCVLAPYIKKLIDEKVAEQEQENQQNGDQSQNGNPGQQGGASGNGSSGKQRGSSGNSSGNSNGSSSQGNSGANGNASSGSNSQGSGTPNANQNGNSGNNSNSSPDYSPDASQSGNGRITQEQLDKIINDIIEQIKNAVDKAGVQSNNDENGQPQSTTSAINNPTNPRNANAPQTQTTDTDKNSSSKGQQQSAASRDGSPSKGPGANSGEASLEAAVRNVNNIIEQTAEKAACALAEKERESAMNKDAKAFKDPYDDATTVSVKIDRAAEVSESNRSYYDAVSDKLLYVSKDLQRGLKRILKDRRDGGKRKNLPFGRKFEATSVIHGDNKYFSKNNIPTEMPRLSVMLLVDESGSTGGELIERATEASIVVEDFCREMEVVNIIMGYTTGGGATCQLKSYVEPYDIDNGNRYRITGMRAGGGTPTAEAMKYAINRLRRIDTDEKILIIISDGGAGDNYQLPDGTRTISRLLQIAKTEKILVVAAGIGNSRSEVEVEFENNFLDISNLDEMPKQLLDIIKDQMHIY